MRRRLRLGKIPLEQQGRPGTGQVAVVADENGDLYKVAEDGTTSAVGVGEPGGGSQPGIEWVRTAVAFDTPNLTVQAFPITGVDLVTNTVTIAGNHAALFPAGRIAAIVGSTGNDYDGYLILSSSFSAGATSVVVDPGGALPTDPTVDGDLINSGTTGVTVATLADGDAVWLGGNSNMPSPVVFRPTAFDGTAPRLGFYPNAAADQGYNALAQIVNLETADSAIGSGAWVAASTNDGSSQFSTRPISGTGSVIAQVFTENTHGVPGSAVGEAVIWLPVLRAP